MAARRYELTDTQWDRIKDLIPRAKTGRPPKDDRMMLNAMLWLARSVFAGTPVTTQAAKLPYYIKINRQQNCVTVYALDSKGKYTKPVKAFACSVGVNNATPTGTFSIPAKYRWHTLMGGVYGQYCSRIHGGVLFHSVFYSSQDPSRLAYNSYNRLGQTASHGCVRLNVEDAKWIYDNCPVGTKVTIYDSKDPGPLGKPTPIRIDVNSPYRGWDPTDPDPRNPWLKLRPTIKGIKNKTIERTNSKVDLKKGVKKHTALAEVRHLIFSGLCRIDFSGNGKFKCLTSVIGSFHTLFQIYFAVCSLDGFILDSLNRRAKFQPWISRIRIGRIPSAVRTVYINTDRGRLAQWSRIFAVIDGYFGSYRAVVIDPLGIFHIQTDTSVGCRLSQTVIRIVCQPARVL